MSKKVSRRLVIDASVARSSGRGDSQDTTSQHCRQFLLVMIYDTKHHVVMSDALKLEWNKHQSRFARRWLIAMESKRRVFHVDILTQGKLRSQVMRVASSKSASEAMLKDMLLIEAAFHTDRVVISLDETVREYFHVASMTIAALTHIVWVNPLISEEKAVEWLCNGAELEGERLLGYRRDASQQLYDC